MNILIAGCSQTGAKLAAELSREGHDVSVVDPSAAAQSLLPDDFTGYFTTGILIDEDVLRNAGIENCDAVAAVSDNDNINIMVSQIAKTIFHIGTVVASLQDPAREEKFGALITTVCPTNIAASSIKGYLLRQSAGQITLGSSTLDVHLMQVPDHLVGFRAKDIQARKGEAVLGVFREGKGLVLSADDDQLLLETDSPYLAPVPYRGKRNSSLNIPLIVQQLAEIKHLSCEEVIGQTGQNAVHLFLANQ